MAPFSFLGKNLVLNDLEHYKHKNNLAPAIMDELKPIFKDLAKTELLRKCVDGYTQNSNESFNNIIWKLCPKRKKHGLVTVNTAVAVAVCLFNDGASSLGAVLKNLQLNPGNFALKFFVDKDTSRILISQRQALHATKEWRRRRKTQRLGRDDDQAEREGNPYLPGGH
eukprot:GHVL01010535.1.p1 GENE.GHVL01010535.1~~GHVL01010535.1.p1  ORF type:complete len:168 (-),score=12.39 GHVL01010535.1:823-1326(-)